ncbi:adenosine deaminase [Paenalcaligenes hominis]|uniref:adenosine deaminase n=1 Tax=Paenalcaligenes hominis TaxID=643674 RepID=A0ABX0WT67_9BURK|nr:hypothetical protein [Paenalcaligenes hominis]NJB65934.1 adenosine deaminase [Paenalcaligenes hominis]GGE70830.1 hypothetical protein GCM10007278_18700 [Paenalcaligenes hominis]
MISAALLLSSSTLLNRYLKQELPSAEEVYMQTQLALRQQLTYLPDFAITSRMQEAGLQEGASYVELFLRAMHYLAQPLHVRGERLYVKPESFLGWQEVLTYIMPLPVIAFFAATQDGGEQKTLSFFTSVLSQFSCLPGPYIPELEQVFQQGVSEHHLHIMGTTESDYVWIDAIKSPKALLANLKKADKNKNARQQIAQLNEELTFSDMHHLLQMATGLRALLLRQVEETPHPTTKGELVAILREWPATYKRPELRRPGLETRNPLVYEAMLLYVHYKHLGATQCEESARTLHLYLLIQAMVHRLLNQQLLDKGFQQFEKITQNELREAVEERFQQRFLQMHSMYNHPIRLLEARFAPKNEAKKLRDLLRAIYDGYRLSNKAAPLSLTAHFIKLPDKPNALHPCRHYALRKRLAMQSTQLQLYRNTPEGQRLNVISIDAAGNELHAGPEVFAPLYRDLRLKGLSCFTYHAGEDFKHLLCGMRQVYEAMHFLDLRAGDRIGHATAIGIHPQLWLERAASRHQIGRGDLLDNLVFAHHLLLQQKDPMAASEAYKLEAKIHEVAGLIFPYDQIRLQTLKTAWANRWRDPLDMAGYEGLSEHVRGVLRAWHSPEVYKRAREQMEVESNLLSVQWYIELQNHILKELHDKRIALEILPTSNVRISYYKNYSEHHVHRWLADTAPPTPAIVVGSDDPGIFATNIFNEYAHIYLSAKQNSTLPNGKALAMIETLLKGGRQYGFRASFD